MDPADLQAFHSSAHFQPETASSWHARWTWSSYLPANLSLRKVNRTRARVTLARAAPRPHESPKLSDSS
jgi:hypothetical protein